MKTKFIKFISICEMIGGIMGLFLTVYLTFFSTNSIINLLSPINYKIYCVLISLFILSLYILSFIAGLFLWKEKKQGIILSIIVQVFQIPVIAVPGFIYSFISGLQIGAALTMSFKVLRITGLFHLGSVFNVYFGSKIEYMTLGVNIMPIVVINYLRRVQKVLDKCPVNEEKELTDLNDANNGERE